MSCVDDAPLPSSDDESEQVLEDSDTCTPFELEQHFLHKYRLFDETALSLKKEYILSLEKDDSLSRLAAGLTDTSVHIFDISSERGLQQLEQISPFQVAPQKDNQICGLRYMDETPNTLLIGTKDGLVRLFDLRTQKEQARFERDTGKGEQAPKFISSFDRNCNSRLLCTGTEEVCSNVYLVFYDLRERRHMGDYFDCHQGDVTSLRFHPQNPDTLASASTDGLINTFDLKEANEDDALQITINTESSVHKINWHRNVYDKDILSCITHTNDFKIYESEEGDSIDEFDRDKITEAIKRTTEANCNLIDAHSLSDGNLFLLTGSNLNKGEIMRSVKYESKKLLPYANFDGNKQIVRESVFDSKSNVLLTAGEGSIVTLWTAQDNVLSTSSGANKLKAKKSKSHKANPY
ncbi:WD repeat-containing protein 89 [Stomoxys calcitrans]|uniref:WD repeat-containing protein 89 n=1 Tax=Stomoxys calcitrans TaxID=35570 RepID=UPI0027E27313|nr:WD repeat-containing protein 89 [Stomoxys calcitrans]